MKDSVRQTRSFLMDLFEEHGISPKHYLGQNFLIDINMVEYVVDQADLSENDLVLEIGAGTGAMTTFLAEQAGEVISVELDPDMYQLVTDATRTFDNVTILNTDALKNKSTFAPVVTELIDQKLSEHPEYKLKLVANLPYAVATPVISNLVASDYDWQRMVVTIQWELGEKMACNYHDSNYGALSVWLQSQAWVKVLKRVKPTVFWPRPKVDSAIVRLLPNKKAKSNIQNREFFHDFIRRLFQQRRKFLRGVLVSMYRKQLGKEAIDHLLSEIKFDEKTRAEELDVPVLVKLSNRIQKMIEAVEAIVQTPDRKK